MSLSQQDKSSVTKKANPLAARALALEILGQAEERGAYLDILLGERLRRSNLSVRDKALVTRLVYGVVSWQGRLDIHIAALCHIPPHQLDPSVRNLLRLGLYQIFFLSRVPGYAIVDTAVRLAKKTTGAAACLVNAVLRRALVEKQKPPLPDRRADPAGYLAAYWSHPRWLVERWVEEFGRAETEGLLQANNAEGATVLRVNSLRTRREQALETLRSRDIAAQATTVSPWGIAVQAGSPIDLPGFAEGKFQVQGEASQLIALLLDPQPGERILDACAAPGGKATHVAELMRNEGEIVALDINTRGLARLRENAGRLGLDIIHPVVGDATCPPLKAKGWFDRILIDAPCSGLGTLRSHPEIKWRRQEKELPALAELQKRILAGVAPLLKKGGVLVYATCTLIRKENEHVVEGFLAEDPNFVREDLRLLLQPPASDLCDEHGFFRTFPHRHNMDGFFAARLRRVSST